METRDLAGKLIVLPTSLAGVLESSPCERRDCDDISYAISERHLVLGAAGKVFFLPRKLRNVVRPENPR